MLILGYKIGKDVIEKMFEFLLCGIFGVWCSEVMVCGKLVCDLVMWFDVFGYIL